MDSYDFLLDDSNQLPYQLDDYNYEVMSQFPSVVLESAAGDHRDQFNLYLDSGYPGIADNSHPASTTSASSPEASSSTAVPLATGSTSASNQGKRLASCAGCRIRRVKCIRPEGSLDCTKCTEKGLTCTPFPTRAKATRTGKRIEQAKLLFGTDKISSSEDFDNQGLFVDAAVQKKRRAESVEELRPNSVVARLVTTELEGALSASLLDLFYRLPQSRISLLESTDFRTTFDASGRRMNQMGAQAQVLCAVICALGARVSNHPLLVGANCPTTRDLAAASFDGTDLSEFGKRRESACVALIESAIKLADSSGTLRVASMESLAALMLFEGIVDYRAGKEIDGIPYAAAYTSHLRLLLEQGQNSPALREQLLGSGLGWNAFVKNSCSSAWRGCTPAFSEDDKWLLTNDPPPPLAELLTPTGHEYLDLNQARNTPFWTFFTAFLFHITDTAALTSSKLTGPGATRKPRIDEAFADEFLERMHLGAAAAHVLHSRALSFLGSWLKCDDKGKIVWGHIKALRGARAAQCMILHRVIGERLEQREREKEKFSAVGMVEIGSNWEEDDYWSRMEILRQRSHKVAFESSREMIAMMKVSLSQGIPMGVMSGTQLFNGVQFWVQILLTQPTAEEGGPLDFTFEEKLSDLRTILRSLYSLGWAFERLSRNIPWLQAEMDKVELAQLLHQYGSPPINSDSSISPESTSVLDIPNIPSTNSTEPMSDAEITGILNDLTSGIPKLPDINTVLGDTTGPTTLLSKLTHSDSDPPTKVLTPVERERSIALAAPLVIETWFGNLLS